jgi:membrane-associated protease RseP (regulator of RpoE activity)
LLPLILLLALTPIVMLGQSSLSVKLDAKGTVAEVLPGGAGAKAGLKLGDTIIGLNNQTLTGGLAEIQSVLAKTRPGSLLPISIRRAGHPMTLLAFPQAAPGVNTTPNTGVPASTGHYTCLTFTFVGTGLGEAPSSLYTGIDLQPGNQYTALRQSGKFHADTKTDRLIFDNGPLANSVAHLERDTNGKPKIVFIQAENQRAINGHEIDHGATACYLR